MDRVLGHAVQSGPYITANLYCICISEYFMFSYPSKPVFFCPLLKKSTGNPYLKILFYCGFLKVALKNMDIYIPYLIKFAAVVIPTKSIALRL